MTTQNVFSSLFPQFQFRPADPSQPDDDGRVCRDRRPVVPSAGSGLGASSPQLSSTVSLNLIPAIFRQPDAQAPARPRFEVPRDADADTCLRMAEEQRSHGHYVEAGMLLQQAAVLNGDDFIHNLPDRTVIPIYDAQITERWRTLADRCSREREALVGNIDTEIQGLRTRLPSLRGRELREAMLRLERLEHAQQAVTVVRGLHFQRDLRPLVDEAVTRIASGALNNDDDYADEGLRVANSLIRYQRVEAQQVAVAEALQRLYPTGTTIGLQLDYSQANAVVRRWIETGPHMNEPSLEVMSHLAIVRTYQALRQSQNPAERQMAQAIEAVLLPTLGDVGTQILPPDSIDGERGLDALSQRLETVYGSPRLEAFFSRVQQTERQDLQNNSGFQNRLALQEGLNQLPQWERTRTALTAATPGSLSTTQLTQYRDQLVQRAQALRTFFDSEISRSHDAQRSAAPLRTVRYMEDGHWVEDQVPDLHWQGPMELEARRNWRQLDAQITQLQGLNPSDGGSLAVLQSATQTTIRLEEAHVRARVEREVQYVSTLPNAVSDATAIEGRLSAIQIGSGDVSSRVTAYQGVLGQVDTAVLTRSVDSRIASFQQMVPTLQTDDRYNIFGYSFAPNAQSMADRYTQVRRMIREGRVDEARRVFVELEQAQMGPDLQGRYESARWTNLGVSVGIIVVSAFVMRQVNLAAGPALVESLGAVWGPRATLALGSIAFRGSSNFLESRMTSDTTAFYDDNRSVFQNAGRFGLQVTQDIGMFAFMGGALGRFNQWADARELGPVMRGFGAFGTELTAIQGWSFGMGTVRNRGDFVTAAGQTILSGAAWAEQTLTLVGIRGGTALSLPVFGPMNQIAEEAATGRYRDIFNRAEAAVQNAQQSWNNYVQNGEGNPVDVISSFRRALEQRQALLDIPELASIRDPQTYQANQQTLEFVRAQEADLRSRTTLFGEGNSFHVQLTSPGGNTGSVPANHAQAFVAALRADAHVSNVQVGENGLITFEYRGPTDTSVRQFRFVTGEPLQQAPVRATVPVPARVATGAAALAAPATAMADGLRNFVQTHTGGFVSFALGCFGLSALSLAYYFHARSRARTSTSQGRNVGARVRVQDLVEETQSDASADAAPIPLVRPRVVAQPTVSQPAVASRSPRWARFLGGLIGVDIRTRNGDPMGLNSDPVPMNVAVHATDEGQSVQITVRSEGDQQTALNDARARAQRHGLSFQVLPPAGDGTARVLRFRVTRPYPGDNVIVGEIRQGTVRTPTRSPLSPIDRFVQFLWGQPGALHRSVRDRSLEVQVTSSDVTTVLDQIRQQMNTLGLQLVRGSLEAGEAGPAERTIVLRSSTGETMTVNIRPRPAPTLDNFLTELRDLDHLTREGGPEDYPHNHIPMNVSSETISGRQFVTITVTNPEQQQTVLQMQRGRAQRMGFRFEELTSSLPGTESSIVSFRVTAPNGQVFLGQIHVGPLATRVTPSGVGQFGRLPFGPWETPQVESSFDIRDGALRYIVSGENVLTFTAELGRRLGRMRGFEVLRSDVDAGTMQLRAPNGDIVNVVIQARRGTEGNAARPAAPAVPAVPNPAGEVTQDLPTLRNPAADVEGDNTFVDLPNGADFEPGTLGVGILNHPSGSIANLGIDRIGDVRQFILGVFEGTMPASELQALDRLFLSNTPQARQAVQAFRAEVRREILQNGGSYTNDAQLLSTIRQVLVSHGINLDAPMRRFIERTTDQNFDATAFTNIRRATQILGHLMFQLFPDDVPLYRAIPRSDIRAEPNGETTMVSNHHGESFWGIGSQGLNVARTYEQRGNIFVTTTLGDLRCSGNVISDTIAASGNALELHHSGSQASSWRRVPVRIYQPN